MFNLTKFKATILFICLTDIALSQLTFSGEIRPRAEFRNGYKTVMDSSQTSAFSVDQRTRLNLKYEIKDYDFYVSLQDVRVWGATGQLNALDGFFSVHEAWAKLKFGTKDKWGLKVGRQEIKYDDDRIMGNVDWVQQARSHDAALVQFNSEKIHLNIGGAFNQLNANLTGVGYTGPSSYRDMYFVHYNHKVSKAFEMSWLALVLGRQAPPQSMNYNTTFGTHLVVNAGKFNLGFNGFYQFGSDVASYVDKTGYSTRKEISGYLLSIDVSYKIAESFKLAIGYETMSGNSTTDTTDSYNTINRGFNPWFGTNHKFNGFMDYFYVGNGHGNVGLQDLFLKLIFSKEKWSVGLDAHAFLSGIGTQIIDKDSYTADFNRLVSEGNLTGASNLNKYDYHYSNYLGAEFDLYFNYQIKESVNLKAGVSCMSAAPSLYALKGTDYYSVDNLGNKNTRSVPANGWGFIMLTFKPTFYKK